MTAITIGYARCSTDKQDLAAQKAALEKLGVLPERHLFKVSPLNRRRWQNFKANRRGYWALWLFMIVFVLSLFAEFIANDKPFYVRYDGRSFFPVFVNYPETAFGGDFETAAD